MSIGLEWKKVKRTGFIPAILVGSVLAAVVPIANMALRSEIYISQSKPPVEILLNANWQMMAMLNILLIVAGACLMYHTEYVNNAIQKMRTLPIKESKLFLSKYLLVMVMSFIVLAVEAVSIAFCTMHWFGQPEGLAIEILKHFSYSFFLILPAILLSLLIASACKNMWVSLGIGVICMFIATMLPTNQFVLSLFPFALPFQIFTGTAENIIHHFVIGVAFEIVGIAVAEMVSLKVRRLFE